MSDEQGRVIDIEETVDASPEEVWEALTTAEGLTRWFPLDARVTPGEGGRVWLSWGPGCEGEAPIHIWDPPARFGWTESYGNDQEGNPVRVAVDFHVTGREGSTVVRLVQSGFSASSDWDEMFDALKDGWTYFMFNLAFHFRVHGGRSRRLVWRRHRTELGRDEIWQRLEASGLVDSPDDEEAKERAGTRSGDQDSSLLLAGGQPGRRVSVRKGHHYAAVVPTLNDALWFVELEGRHVGFWLSVYDQEGVDADALQAELDERAGTVLGASA